MDIKELVVLFSPVVWLHSKENFFPDRVETYIENSSVWRGKEKVADHPTIEQISTVYSAPEFALKADPNGITGNKKLEDVPVYVRIQELETEYRLVYFYFYPFNGALNIGGFPAEKWLIKKGDHEADVEKITIFVNKNTQKISRVYLGAHGSKDGVWLAEDQLEYENGKPVVYSAWHSHAFYSSPGIHWRILGFANDYTNKGIKWSPRIQVVEEDVPVWQKYQGSLGYPDHCNIFRHRGWDDDPQVSTNFWCRMFGCLRK